MANTSRARTRLRLHLKRRLLPRRIQQQALLVMLPDLIVVRKIWTIRGQPTPHMMGLACELGPEVDVRKRLQVPVRAPHKRRCRDHLEWPPVRPEKSCAKQPAVVAQARAQRPQPALRHRGCRRPWTLPHSLRRRRSPTLRWAASPTAHRRAARAAMRRRGGPWGHVRWARQVVLRVRPGGRPPGELPLRRALRQGRRASTRWHRQSAPLKASKLPNKCSTACIRRPRPATRSAPRRLQRRKRTGMGAIHRWWPDLRSRSARLWSVCIRRQYDAIWVKRKHLSLLREPSQMTRSCMPFMTRRDRDVSAASVRKRNAFSRLLVLAPRRLRRATSSR
mmetsp:Transcript_19675/g.49833  ORF Transcript_19675/g.49833 Transcript_19675/m.49833 type:complete len:335 (+) Transcript_19675:131-1135(+)